MVKKTTEINFTAVFLFMNASIEQRRVIVEERLHETCC